MRRFHDHCNRIFSRAADRLTLLCGRHRSWRTRRRGRVAEGGGLLNRYTLQRRIEGSNPSVSARFRQTLEITSMRRTEAAPIVMRRKISSDVRLARAAGANRGPLVSTRKMLKSGCRAELSAQRRNGAYGHVSREPGRKPPKWAAHGPKAAEARQKALRAAELRCYKSLVICLIRQRVAGCGFL